MASWHPQGSDQSRIARAGARYQAVVGYKHIHKQKVKKQQQNFHLHLHIQHISKCDQRKGGKNVIFYLGAMGEVKQVGHDFLWEHNTQIQSQLPLQFVSDLITVFPETLKPVPQLHTYTHISVFVVAVGS